MFEYLKDVSEKTIQQKAYDTKSSMWIDYSSKSDHLTQMPEIENKKDFLDYMVTQFQNTPASLHESLKSEILNWITEMDSMNIEEETPDELRDFIYEMF